MGASVSRITRPRYKARRVWFALAASPADPVSFYFSCSLLQPGLTSYLIHFAETLNGMELNNAATCKVGLHSRPSHGRSLMGQVCHGRFDNSKTSSPLNPAPPLALVAPTCHATCLAFACPGCVKKVSESGKVTLAADQ